MTYYDIVPAVFSFFFKDLNVLPAVLCTIAYRLPIWTRLRLRLPISTRHIDDAYRRDVTFPQQNVVPRHIFQKEVKSRYNRRSDQM